MSTIAAAVFDVVASTGCGCSMRGVIKALPDIDPASVASAVHRLTDRGTLKSHREIGSAVYAIAPGATRPTDSRGRPRKSEQSHDSCSFKPMGDAP
jgi:hypothetical protein